MHAKAKAYMESDPEVSLMLARKAAEAIAKFLYREHVHPEAGTMMLEKLIEQLTTNKQVPKSILLHLRTIQTHGNFGAHDQDDDNEAITSDYVLPCLNSLDFVSAWLASKYLKAIDIPSKIIVHDLAELMGLRPFQLIKDLMALGVFANINQLIDFDLAAKIAELHGVKYKQKKK